MACKTVNKRPTIICISGKAQHGKDTLANYLMDDLEEHGGCLICHYGDVLKYVCKNFFDWDGAKDEKGRSLLQTVGTDIVRKKHPNFWTDFLTTIVRSTGDKWSYIIIPDCRFDNEIDCWDALERYSIYITRPNFDNGLTEEQQNHPSESGVDIYSRDYDFIVENKWGLYELQVAAQHLAHAIASH